MRALLLGMTEQPLVTPAWRLVGATRSVPGVLALDQGRVSFTTDEGTEFVVPASTLEDVKFPWYYFNGGVKLKANGQSYRFSFLKPDAGEEVPAHLLGEKKDALTGKERVAEVVGILALDFEAASFARGRRAGKAWKSVLSQEPPPQ